MLLPLMFCWDRSRLLKTDLFSPAQKKGHWNARNSACANVCMENYWMPQRWFTQRIISVDHCSRVWNWRATLNGCVCQTFQSPMGLVYLPTFTTNINHPCRQINANPMDPMGYNALDHPTFVSAFRLAAAFYLLQGASADIETRRNLQSKDGIGGGVFRKKWSQGVKQHEWLDVQLKQTRWWQLK